jgi:hypothetical protein
VPCPGRPRAGLPGAHPPAAAAAAAAAAARVNPSWRSGNDCDLLSLLPSMQMSWIGRTHAAAAAAAAVAHMCAMLYSVAPNA